MARSLVRLQSGRQHAAVPEALLLTVSIPPRTLSPNARVHWAVLMKAKRQVRVESWASVQIPMHEQDVKGGWKGAECRVVWYARDSRRRDRDNLLASLKATFDGLVDGGLLVDDAGITHLPLSIEVDAKRPRVELHLRQTDAKA
jgi:Holliday junction resolvase RusA-like endonuclease